MSTQSFRRVFIRCFAVAGIAFVIPLGQAHADPSPLAASIASLIDGINTEQAKEPKLREESAALLQKNEQLKREYDIYTNQIETRLGPIAAAIKADGQALEHDVARHNAGVARHNGNCAGTLERPQYERCEGEKRVWDAKKERLDARKEGLQRRAADLGRQLRPYTERMDQIAEQMKRNFAASNRLRDAMDAARGRAERMKAQLVDACGKAAEATDLEALHHCHSVRWDGARVDLPPLADTLP